jgi:hypothetical protein
VEGISADADALGTGASGAPASGASAATGAGLGGFGATGASGAGDVDGENAIGGDGGAGAKAAACTSAAWGGSTVSASASRAPRCDSSRSVVHSPNANANPATDTSRIAAATIQPR